MAQNDYFRPRGDITTVLDLCSRDSQDNTYFPLNTDKSWFHRDSHSRVFPTTLSVQEFTQRGPADWGQKFSFEIGSLPAGDLLQTVILQFRLDSWYNGQIVNNLESGLIQTNIPALPANTTEYWTYINSLGTSIIEYADFIVNDQTKILYVSNHNNINRVCVIWIQAAFRHALVCWQLVYIGTLSSGNTRCDLSYIY